MEIITGKFKQRSPELTWEDLGPGLYPGERAVRLSSGEKAAVSVDPRWLPNGAGVWLNGNARLIDDDGQTIVAPDGEHVETNLAATVSASDVAEFGLAKLAKDVARLLVGESAELMRPENKELEVPEMPVIDVSKDVLDSISIRNAAAAVKAVDEFSLRLS